MLLYSTNNTNLRSSFREALFQGLPTDNGLYMPFEILTISPDFIKNIDQYSFQEIAFEVAHSLIGSEIPEIDLQKTINEAINFPAPVVQLDSETFVLELFHGPSLAFKDFGARFMAQTMSYFNQEKTEVLTILVATSGDTGGAVAAGYYQTPGIQVVILYPSGKVSPLQEKQLAGLGKNITALEIDGTFDDCQTLVKQAFLDTELREKLHLSSANSINISRLIPQVFYYFEAYKQLYRQNHEMTFVVPSGNFGNLTAGLISQKMGLPVHHFIAATNANDVVPQYLNTGLFQPKPSIATLSNAMDVGNPSNFSRILDLYGSTWNIMKEHISGYAFSDASTKAAMLEIYNQYNYIMDPHGAVAYLAWKAYQQEKKTKSVGVILETAHPAKFVEDVEKILNIKIDIPQRLAILAQRKKVATNLGVEYSKFKTWLLDHLSF